MSNVRSRWARPGAGVDPEDLIDRMSRDLERAISFAEECRWHCPELQAEADQLSAAAMALFGKTVRGVQGAGAARV